MNNTLSIHHTVTPEGQTIRHLNNTMRKPEVICMREVMKQAVVNTIRKGGICYQDLTLVEQAKKLIAR